MTIGEIFDIIEGSGIEFQYISFEKRGNYYIFVCDDYKFIGSLLEIHNKILNKQPDYIYMHNLKSFI